MEPEREEPLRNPLPPIFIQQGREGFKVIIGKLELPNHLSCYTWDEEGRERGYSMIRLQYGARGLESTGRQQIADLEHHRMRYEKDPL